MSWLIYAIVLLAIVAAFFADTYARKHKLGFYAKKNRKSARHADTGDFPVIEHETAKGYADYRTAEIPLITEAKVFPVKAIIKESEIQTQAGQDYIKARYGELPPVPPVRTDTVMAEAIDPKNYPEWAK